MRVTESSWKKADEMTGNDQGFCSTSSPKDGTRNSTVPPSIAAGHDFTIDLCRTWLFPEGLFSRYGPGVQFLKVPESNRLSVRVLSSVVTFENGAESLVTLVLLKM